MKSSPAWEILIGSASKLDWFVDPMGMEEPHPLQELMEEFVETQLDEYDRELYYMRYGEQLPIRTIARRLGYNSHYVVQVQLERIEKKARKFIERDTSTLDSDR